MENDNLKEVEEETSEEAAEETEEDTEEETSEEAAEVTKEETSNEENSYDPESSSYETVLLTTPDSLDTNDYSSYFENLQSLGIIITAFILGLGLALAFALGFKKE